MFLNKRIRIPKSKSEVDIKTKIVSVILSAILFVTWVLSVDGLCSGKVISLNILPDQFLILWKMKFNRALFSKTLLCTLIPST